MAAMALPIAPGKLDAWRSWINELNGNRKEEFAASNARHQLTGHHAWLQPNPDGSHLAVVVHEGPGADAYTTSVTQSSDPFDQWLVKNIAEAHGMDPNGPLPPPNEQVL